MKWNMKQWVADVIRQKEVLAVPVMTHPGIEQNKHTVREAVSDGRVHAEAVVWLTQHFIPVLLLTYHHGFDHGGRGLWC